MNSKVWIVIVVGAAVALASSGLLAFPEAAQQGPASEHNLRVEEAKSFVKLFELRLYNAKARADQEDLKWAAVNETFARVNESHSKGAIPEKAFREAKEQFEWWKLQDNIKDWQEVEVQLELAKIRLQMVEQGMAVYHGALP